MKTIIFFFFTFFLFLSIGCSKNLSSTAEFSKPDLLFQQVKNDPDFYEYLQNINSTMKIIQANAANGKAVDSVILKDKSKTVDQKFATLKYTGLDSINNNIEKSRTLFKSISNKYPLILSLTKDEQKLFYREANAYFFGIKTK